MMLGTVLEKGLEKLEIGGRIETIQNNRIVEIGQNTEESPEDMKWLAITHIQKKKKNNK